MYFTLPKLTRRKHTVSEMKLTRLPNEPVWTEIGSLALPFRMRLYLSDYNKAQSKNTQLYNSTATRALKVLQSGLMTAAMDPSSQWVALTLEDAERAEYGPHREWLDEVGTLLLQDMEDSNIYRTFPQGLGNMAAFGFMTLGMEEWFGRATVDTHLYPPGSSWIGEDGHGQVRLFYREYRCTVRQAYLRFGKEGDFSPELQRKVDLGEWEEVIDLANFVEPNEDYKPGSPLSKHKEFSSCWYELGLMGSGPYASALKEDRYLEEKGFDLFPIVAPRWSQTEGEVYPSEYPGSESLPDNKTLQIGEKRMWQLIEKGVNPHMLIPASLQGQMDSGMIPGRSSYVGSENEGKIIRAAQEMNPAFVSPLREQLGDVVKRINDNFHYPTFAVLESLPDKDRTATEVVQRKAEQLLKLVDMYSNLQGGGLSPVVDYYFSVRQRRNMLPPAPPDLQGHPIKYRFNGTLAMAQKMNRVQPVQAVLGTVQELAQIQGAAGMYPEALDKFNTDQAIDEISTNLNIPASIIRSDAEVAAIRQGRLQAQQAQQKMAALEQASKAAKNFGQAPLDGQNALTALIGK